MRMEIDPFKSAGSPKRRPTPGQHFPGCLASGLRGGVFHTLGADGLAAHAFERGDATFFLSQKMHSVSRLDAGERRVLVLELWEGGENHAPLATTPCRKDTACTAALHGAAPVNRRPRATSLTAGRATGGRTCSPQIRSRRRGCGGRGTATRAACRRPPPLSLTTSRSRRGSKRATTRAREV